MQVPTNITSKYILTASVGEGGRIAPTRGVLMQAEVTISASPDEGYEFSEWSIVWNTNPTTFKLNSKKQLQQSLKMIKH